MDSRRLARVVPRRYTASFEKRDAVETVTPMRDDGTWRVSGYSVH